MLKADVPVRWPNVIGFSITFAPVTIAPSNIIGFSITFGPVAIAPSICGRFSHHIRIGQISRNNADKALSPGIRRDRALF
ncbi:hypothetical protein C162_16165 [Paenibacillus sp. FSL R7-269]|uniref:hypothetical protein n=1 Tax=Paenibacillus sp. FSL R7-269 TaxID=1226755 RepID=UPI0003E28EC7|nr:hypothetical protein [Paenibacillus sp. FSL R7-269]ETT48035.1 hypothetical protein C162_16165 [Paenibacillus sp. FSL R7-269]